MRAIGAMSACKEFREFLAGMINEAACSATKWKRMEEARPRSWPADTFPTVAAQTELNSIGEIARTFDEIHQKNCENTGDKCGIGEVTNTVEKRVYTFNDRKGRAQAKAQKISATLTRSSFDDNSEVRIVHGDGSVFHLKRAFLQNWEDEDGQRWVAAFSERVPVLLFEPNELREHRQLKAVEE